MSFEAELALQNPPLGYVDSNIHRECQKLLEGDGQQHGQPISEDEGGPEYSKFASVEEVVVNGAIV